MTWQDIVFGPGLGLPQAARQGDERLAGPHDVQPGGKRVRAEGRAAS
ncbi:hypothetical protein [Streptomyces cinnamoneus]|nr:hypothetical protein [Streptomyces cinnamoneus]